MPRRSHPVLDFLTYALYRIVAAGICLLPLSWGFRLGACCGLLLHAGSSKLRNLARRNLAIAYREEKSPSEIETLARDHFRLLGANLVSSIKIGSLSPEQIFSRITTDYTPAALAIQDDKAKGWIAMISHLGNWEIFARLGLLIPDYPMGAVYRPIPNRYFDAHIRETRARYGVELFDRFKDLTKAPGFLRRGGALGILVDQYAGDLGLWTPFFDRLASTTTLAASYAIRAKVPIVPLAVYTTGTAHWKIVAYDPLPREETNINRLTAIMNQALETQIRASPADWLWCHNRWKTPRRFLLSQSKRGTTLAPGQSPEDLQPFPMLVVTPSDRGSARACLPAVNRIREGRPDARLTILADRDQNDLWTPLPEVTTRFSGDGPAALEEVTRQVREAGPFEAAFVFTQDPHARRAVEAAGIPRVVAIPANETLSEETFLALVRSVES